MDTPTIASDGIVYLSLANQSTVLAMHPNGSLLWARGEEGCRWAGQGAAGGCAM
jgi:hypothetical protein